jgi:hypothetical protein
MKISIPCAWLLSLPLLADDFINLTFDSPDLTGSLKPVFASQQNGPFFGEASRLLRGWTFTSAGLPAQQSTYSPWPTSASERTLNLWANRPEEVNGAGGDFFLFVFSGGNPLGPELRLSQTGMIPADAVGLHIFAPRLRDMRINGQMVTDPLLGFLADPVIDVSSYAGQVTTIEFVFRQGFSGGFDIYGFTQIPEPSTWALFGVGSVALGWAVKQLRSP